MCYHWLSDSERDQLELLRGEIRREEKFKHDLYEFKYQFSKLSPENKRKILDELQKL